MCTVGSCTSYVTKPQGNRTIENTRNPEQLNAGDVTIYTVPEARITFYAQNTSLPYTAGIVHIYHIGQRDKFASTCYVYIASWRGVS